MNTNSSNSSGQEIPLFKSWQLWYILVLTNHLVLIILFYLFMKYFS